MILSAFTLVSATGGPAYADAWADYQTVKAAHKAQNRQLLKDFREGKISAGELQDAWKNMRDEAAAAAQRTADEWAGEKPEDKDPEPAQPTAQPKDGAQDRPAGTASGNPDFTVHPEGGRLQGPGVSFEEGDYNFVPRNLDTEPPPFRAPGLDPETGRIEYRTGSEDTVIRKMPGLKKYTNITVKRGVLDNDAVWYLPSWEELQKTAIPGDPQPPAQSPQPEMSKQERARKGRGLEEKIRQSENQIEENKKAYEKTAAEVRDARDALKDAPGSGSEFTQRFQLLTGRWLQAQMLLLMLIFLVRILWLYIVLFNDVMGMMFASDKFGVNPFGGRGSLIGRDLIFGDGAGQVQKDDRYNH